MPTLYHNPASPFARKCVASVEKLGAEHSVTMREIGVKPDAVNDDLVKVNPLGKLPTLQTDNGELMFDSRVICAYLNDRFDGDLYGTFDINALRGEALADGICDAAVALRYETFARPEAYQWPEYIERLKVRIMNGCEAWNADTTILDVDRLDGIAAVVTLDYLDFRHAENVDWRSTCRALATWHEQAKDAPHLASTRPA